MSDVGAWSALPRDTVGLETAQWLRTLVALAMDLGSVPSTHKESRNHLYNSNSDLHGHQKCTWCSYKQTHKINLKRKKTGELATPVNGAP